MYSDTSSGTNYNDTWYYIRIRAISGSAVNPGYYFLGTDTNAYEANDLKWYGTSLSNVSYEIGNTYFMWHDDNSANGENAQTRYWYSYGTPAYKVKQTSTEYINPTNDSGYYIDGNFTRYKAGSSNSTVKRVYLHPNPGSSYRGIGQYLDSNSNLQELKNDEYIKFSIGNATLYIFDGLVYTTAPTQGTSQATITLSDMNTGTTSQQQINRTFYFSCKGLTLSTSSTGSKDGRTKIISYPSSVTKCYMRFNSSGQLEGINSGTSTSGGFYNISGGTNAKIIKIKDIGTSSTQANSNGMVFANGYLIKIGCDSIGQDQ